MKAATPKIHRASPDRPAHDGVLGPSTSESAVVGLSGVGRRWRSGPRGSGRAPRRFRPILTLLTALLVGAALMLAGNFEYLCGATLRLVSATGLEQVDPLRKDLWDFARLQLGHSAQPYDPTRWFVDSPDPTTLRLCVMTADPRSGVETLRNLAGAFLSKVANDRAEARSEPSRAEHLLSDRRSELKARLDAAQAQLESLGGFLPEANPGPEQAEKLAAWNRLRARFTAVRQSLTEAVQEAAHLHAAPKPTYGIVPARARASALEADSALQQDLSELQVNLAELKRHLLDVWQASAAPLDGLTDALTNLLRAARSPADPSLPQHQRSSLELLAAETKAFLADTETFHRYWNDELAALRRLETDPLEAGEIAVHRRSDKLLRDFLFEGDRHAQALRADGQAFVDAASQHARYHTIQSDITRRLAAFESAYRRFRPAARGIDTRENFRLDAALRGARGLRRRTRERIERIDEGLQTKALAEALRNRQANLVKADEKVKRIRADADDIIKELVTLQDDLNLTAGLTDRFLRASLNIEFMTDRMRLAQGDLDWTMERLDELAAQRTAAPDLHLSLAECGVIDGPLNLWQRAGIGGVGALVTLLSVTLCQWWLIRRE